MTSCKTLTENVRFLSETQSSINQDKKIIN